MIRIIEDLDNRGSDNRGSTVPKWPEVASEWQEVSIRTCSSCEAITFTRFFCFCTYGTVHRKLYDNYICRLTLSPICLGLSVKIFG